MQRRLLIDGDIVVYRFACRSECAVQWTSGEVSAVGDVDQARVEAKQWIDGMMEKLEAEEYLLVFGDNEHRSFRYDLYPQYKAHRTQGRPPVHRMEVEKMLRAEFPTKSRPGLEADDVMGILATAQFRDKQEVIVTIDKDLETVPGSHFNYRKDKSIRSVSVSEAELNHLLLTLVGDTADGFKGLPRVGPKTAAAALIPLFGSVPRMWAKVVSMFEAKGLTSADALLQARLARVLWSSDYDFVSKKPILWTPPQL